MANRVMRMPQNTSILQTYCASSEQKGQVQPKFKGKFLGLKPMLQRLLSPKDKIQSKPQLQKMGSPEEESLQAKSLMMKSTGGGGVATSALTSRLSSSKSNGSPLPVSTNQFMSNAFGTDFSKVRIHTGNDAIQMNQNLNARAFTHGSDVYFNRGEYSPNTSKGKRLLGHELTHVVQQQAVQRQTIQRTKDEKKPCSVHVYDNSDPKDTAVIPDDKSGIGVSSVDDMVSKVKAYVADPKNNCSCVHRLEINGHGADGNQSVGAGKGNDADKILDADSKASHLNKLSTIKFCSKGLFMLLGCHIGRSERGKKLLSRLANILPGKLIGGAKHYTGGTGLGNKRVTGEGDKPNTKYSERDPFLTSKYVRWHVVIDGKEYIINGDKTNSTEGQSKLKKGDQIKVVKPDGEVIKIK